MTNKARENNRMNRYFNSRYWLQAWKLYDLVPMKAKSVLLDEGFPIQRITLYQKEEFKLSFPVYCLPKPNNGYAKHRIFAVCDCGKHVPFGRMQQHYMTKPCMNKL